MARPKNGPDRLLRRLAGRRALARLALLFERVWPALWPPLGVAGLFLCAALLDLPRLLPPTLHLTLLVATVVAIVVLLLRGWRGLNAPDDAAADRRLEVASGLRHRPLSVLTDRPAGHDPAADPLWRAHVERAIRQLRRLRVGLPRPGLARARSARAARRPAGRPGRRPGHRRPGRAGADRRGAVAQPAARAGRAGDRVAGLDHAARLHPPRADLPARRHRQRHRARRLPPDDQRHRQRRRAEPGAERPRHAVPRPRRVELPGRPGPDRRRPPGGAPRRQRDWQAGT